MAVRTVYARSVAYARVVSRVTFALVTDAHQKDIPGVHDLERALTAVRAVKREVPRARLAIRAAPQFGRPAPATPEFGVEARSGGTATTAATSRSGGWA